MGGLRNQAQGLVEKFRKSVSNRNHPNAPIGGHRVFPRPGWDRPEFEFRTAKDARRGAQVAGRLDLAAQRGEFILLRQRRDGNGNRLQLLVRSSRG